MDKSQRSRLLRECLQLAQAGGEPLLPLSRAVGNATRRLDEPMRLAVAGQIKRGKSTLVNALLGTEIAATGQLELTFTVNEFYHADEPVVTVHYKDKTTEVFSPEALRELTVRTSQGAERLRRIRKVEYGLPNALLSQFRLVDTPGLASVYGADSANAMDILGLSEYTSDSGHDDTAAALEAMGRKPEEVHQDSAIELDHANAILYLYSRALHEGDRAAIEGFVGEVTASMTPLKAFGVLSRCDQYWPPGPDLPGDPDPMTYDPMAVAASLADQDLAVPKLGRLFFTVVPVAGLVGVGAQTLTGQEFDWLDDLRGASPRVLVGRLRDANWFASSPQLPGIALDQAYRAQLVGRLGVWGIHKATCYLRDGLSTDEVRDRLVTDSGVARLRQLVTGHFGNRSTLIRFGDGLSGISAEIDKCRLAAQHAGVRPPAQVADVAAHVEKLRNGEPGFAEFGILSDYYNGRLSFTAGEADELLRVTGEYGTTVAARLDLPESSSLAELERVATERIDAWAQREQDPMLERRTGQAAYVLRRCYERIAHRIRLAKRQLETDTDTESEFR